MFFFAFFSLPDSGINVSSNETLSVDPGDTTLYGNMIVEQFIQQQFAEKKRTDAMREKWRAEVRAEESKRIRLEMEEELKRKSAEKDKILLEEQLKLRRAAEEKEEELKQKEEVLSNEIVKARNQSAALAHAENALKQTIAESQKVVPKEDNKVLPENENKVVPENGKAKEEQMDTGEESNKQVPSEIDDKDNEVSPAKPKETCEEEMDTSDQCNKQVPLEVDNTENKVSSEKTKGTSEEMNDNSEVKEHVDLSKVKKEQSENSSPAPPNKVTPIQTTDGQNDLHPERTTDPKMAFEFDNDGLPIWEEKVFPIEKMPPKPDFFFSDLNSWRKSLDDHYCKIRRKQYDLLHRHCLKKLTRKRAKEQKEREEKERKETEQRQRKQKEEAERRAAEDLRKQHEEEEKKKEEERALEEKRQNAVKMQEQGMASVESYFKQAWDGMSINLSDDDDAATSPAESDEHNKEENGLIPPAHIKMEQDDEDNKQEDQLIPPADIKMEENGSRRPLGSEISDDSVSDVSSAVSHTPVRRSPRISRIKTKNDKYVAPETVELLSNPQILRALQSFQGITPDYQVDISILYDPNVLAALKCLHENAEYFCGPATSTPINVNIDTNSGNLIPIENIKKEDDDKKEQLPVAKRKLTDLQSFQDAMKKNPGRKRRKKETGAPEVDISLGSPVRGEIVSRDISTEKLLEYTKPKVEIMRAIDSSMRKTPISSAKMTRGLFDKVQAVHCF